MHGTAFALLGLVVALLATGCAASSSGVSSRVADDLRARTAASVRTDGAQTPSVPPGVRLDDGLSREDAVALALWNSPSFQVGVSQLGFAQADLVDAGLIANPVLSLLFPAGPKQMEATLRWPAEVFWERPRRMKAARLSLDAGGNTLVQAGLDLVLATRVSYADLALADARLDLAGEAAGILERIDSLSQSRLRAGDIAELEARAAHVDAARARQDAERAVHDVTIARERLRAILGLASGDTALDRLQATTDAPAACGGSDELLTRALAARPDVRAAELTIDASAARLGWERSRVLALTAVLDANGQGLEGFEMGPGVDVSVPIFNRNQGGRLRAQSELQRASAAYLALQRQVALDVREAHAQLAQARESRAVWGRDIVARLRANLSDAEEAFASGDSAYLLVLENSRRLIEARIREREIAADEQRAQARVERASGMACAAHKGENQ
jgi:cobalt-zinc-cadmium efflux system outer membrane protein